MDKVDLNPQILQIVSEDLVRKLDTQQDLAADLLLFEQGRLALLHQCSWVSVCPSLAQRGYHTQDPDGEPPGPCHALLGFPLPL